MEMYGRDCMAELSTVATYIGEMHDEVAKDELGLDGLDGLFKESSPTVLAVDSCDGDDREYSFGIASLFEEAALNNGEMGNEMVKDEQYVWFDNSDFYEENVSTTTGISNSKFLFKKKNNSNRSYFIVVDGDASTSTSGSSVAKGVDSNKVVATVGKRKEQKPKRQLFNDF